MTGRFRRVSKFNSGAVLSDLCIVADSYWLRLKGWLGVREVSKGQGIWFPKSTSVHMWGMRATIDVVFFRREKKAGEPTEGIVTSIHSRVLPWKFFPLFDAKATDVLELAPGIIEEKGVVVGDKLCIELL